MREIKFDMSAKPTKKQRHSTNSSVGASVGFKKRAENGIDQAAINHPWAKQKRGAILAALISAKKGWNDV